MPPQKQQAALHAHRTDISFLRRPTEDAELIDELAWPETVAVALPEQHPLAAQQRISLPLLREESFVFLRLEDSRFAQYLRECCVEAGFLPRISQQVVDAQSIPSLIEAGFGISIVPAAIATLTAGPLVFLPIRPDPPLSDVFMVYRRDDPAPVLRSFLAEMRTLLEEKPAASAG